MDKLTSKKALLESIRLSENATFECDENAILAEYTIQHENKSSLAIKLLSIFGGFLATLAFLGFLAIAGLYNSESGLLLFGIVFIVSAIWLDKVYHKLIIDTFSVSLYVVGLCLFAFGLSEMDVDQTIIALLISLIALSSLIITQNFILSFISVLAVSGSILFLIISNHLYNSIHIYIAIHTIILTYVFLNEAKIISSNKRLSKLYNPLRIGLIFSLLFGLITIGKRHLVPISQNYIWASSIAMIFVALYIVYSIIKIHEINTIKNKIMIYTLSALIIGSTLLAPSILGAMIIILLSFLVNYKTGLAIGIISMIYFISQYYYDLNLTLLTKSILLFISGIIFLVFFLFTTQNSPSHEKI